MDGRASRAFFELRGGPAEKLRQRGGIEAMAHFEIRVRSRVGEFVPGTDELTVIAPEDAVADGRPQLDGNRALVLDGEIGDAAPCIELVWRDNGSGGTCRDARLTGA